MTIESLQFKEGGIFVLGTEVRLGTLSIAWPLSIFEAFYVNMGDC